MTENMFILLIEKGGILMLPLLLCSVIAITIIIERSIFWAQISRHRNKALINDALHHMEHGDIDRALSLTAASRDYVAVVFYEGLKQPHHLHATFDRATSEQLEKMRKGMAILDTIVSVAPLLGILGTVIGIIQSFDLLGESSISDPKAISGGIAQALITTATGLAISIATMLPNNIFTRKVEKICERYTQYLSQFEVAYTIGRQSS